VEGLVQQGLFQGVQGCELAAVEVVKAMGVLARRDQFGDALVLGTHRWLWHENLAEFTEVDDLLH